MITFSYLVCHLLEILVVLKRIILETLIVLPDEGEKPRSSVGYLVE